MNVGGYKIYTVEGAEQVAKLAEFATERAAKGKAQHKWCKARGATGCMVHNYPYAIVVPAKKDGPLGWRRHRDQKGVPFGSVAWSPDLKTRDGRLLSKELRGLKIPGADDAAAAIGITQIGLVPFENGMALLCSQCVQVGDVWVLLYPKAEKATKLPGCRLLKLSEFYAMKEAAEAAEPAPA